MSIHEKIKKTGNPQHLASPLSITCHVLPCHDYLFTLAKRLWKFCLEAGFKPTAVGLISNQNPTIQYPLNSRNYEHLKRLLTCTDGGIVDVNIHLVLFDGKKYVDSLLPLLASAMAGDRKDVGGKPFLQLSRANKVELSASASHSFPM